MIHEYSMINNDCNVPLKLRQYRVVLLVIISFVQLQEFFMTNLLLLHALTLQKF